MADTEIVEQGAGVESGSVGVVASKEGDLVESFLSKVFLHQVHPVLQEDVFVRDHSDII